MCAQFLIKVKFHELKNRFGLPENDELEWAEHILPYRPAPVILQGKDQHFHLHLMNFSLIPHWSKDPKVKFATHNARVESITEKPTWRKSFREKRCLVPLTGFIEPIYQGELAGSMVDFHQANNDLLVAAGLYDEWLNPQTGEIIESFAIITHEPSEFVKQMGHDREPLFLNERALKIWTTPEPCPAQDLLQILGSERAHPAFAATEFRKLKIKLRRADGRKKSNPYVREHFDLVTHHL